MPSIRNGAGAAAAGNITVDIDLGRGHYLLKFVSAGFETSIFGNIKILLKHREVALRNVYVDSGISTPSPGGAHASIVTWQGEKMVDGNEYEVRVLGISNVANDNVFVTVDYTEVEA